MKEKLVKYRTKGNTNTVKAEKHNPELKLRWHTQEAEAVSFTTEPKLKIFNSTKLHSLVRQIITCSLELPFSISFDLTERRFRELSEKDPNTTIFNFPMPYKYV